jgi:hypothetical protein
MTSEPWATSQLTAATESTKTTTASNSTDLTVETGPGWSELPVNKTFIAYFGDSVDPINSIASYGGEGGGEWGKDGTICGDSKQYNHFITGIKATGEGFDNGIFYLDNLRFTCRRAGQSVNSAPITSGAWIRQPAPNFESIAHKGTFPLPSSEQKLYILTGYYGGAGQYKDSTVLTKISFVFRLLGENGIDYNSPARIVAITPPGVSAGFFNIIDGPSGISDTLQPLLCPKGAAVETLFGNAGEVIDRLGIMCRKVMILKASQ